MKNIKWVDLGTKRYHCYKAKIGCLNLYCRESVMVGATKNRKCVMGWCCTVCFGNNWIAYTETRKLVKSAQEDGERLAIQYLFGCGSIVLKELKRMGLLEEMLSEVGVDL